MNPLTEENNSIESVVAEAVKTKVQTMVIDAMGEPGLLVKQIVHEALTMPYKDSSYPYKTEPVIHRITREAIVDEAKMLSMSDTNARLGLFDEFELRRRLPSPKLQKAIRKATATTQQAVADELAVSRITVARWEAGLRRPRGQMLRRYIDLLDRLKVEAGL